MIYIMCGVPGCGKSTLANKIASANPTKIVSADHYFYNMNGEYNFVREELGEAHEQCRTRYLFHMATGKSAIHVDGKVVDAEDIIVDNTNCRLQDLMWYIDNAAPHMPITIVYLSAGDVTACAERNVHGVPQEVISRMLVQQVDLLVDLTSHWDQGYLPEYEDEVLGRHRIMTLLFGQKAVSLLYKANNS